MPDAGGPYEINEGDSLTLDTSASTDADSDPLSFSWDVNEDSVFGDAIGVNPTLTWIVLQALGIADDGLFNVILRVDNGNGGVAEGSSSLTVVNVAPSVGVITAPVDLACAQRNRLQQAWGAELFSGLQLATYRFPATNHAVL